MANIARPLEILRDGQNLKFGKNTYPIGHAVSVWVKDAKERKVILCCENNGYFTFLEFQMENVKEMNRLIEEIVKDDKIRVTLPHILHMSLKTDLESQKKYLEFIFDDEEDQALHQAYTQPFVDKLYTSGRTADQIFAAIRANLAVPTPQMDLAARIKRVGHFQLPEEAAYDHVSDGFLEKLQVADEEGKPIVQVGYLDRLLKWMNTPSEAGDQIERYAEIFERQISYRRQYKKGTLPAFYNHIVKMGVFNSRLEKIFGNLLSQLASKGQISRS